MNTEHREKMALPPGWIREEIIRQCGLSAGRTDVYYITPDGKRVRSKPQLARILGESFDLNAFDFRSGRVVHSTCRKSKRQKASSYDFARGVRHDASLMLPIRQTASIFKQPVTVVKNRNESRSKSDVKHGAQDQPKQVFWEKRLQGLRAYDNNNEWIPSMELPRLVQTVGPDLSTENALHSISAALHNNQGPVYGQSGSRQNIQKNPSIHMDTQQPHIQQLVVTSEDIHRQEQRVSIARKRLQAMLESADE